MVNLLIFFDNQSFKVNNIIISYIKRWIVYKIINRVKEYKCIFVYKTYPEFCEKIIPINSIEDNIEDNIKEILINFNNVIYKTSEKYATIRFKNIIDKIVVNESLINKSLIDKSLMEEKNNEILIITSMEDNIFTDYNINYVNAAIDKIKSEINLINISSTKIFKKIFPKIKENIVDIDCLKAENTNIKNMINYKEINNFEEIKKYTNSKYVSGFEFLKLMCCIENLILSNLILSNPTLNSEQNKIIILIINQINIFDFENFNIHLQNIFKSYKNTIKDILNTYTNLLIKLPVDKLTPELSTSYIKYILEFYSIIYPKINYYKSLAISNDKKNKQKKIFETTSEIKIKNIKNIEVELDDISCQYLTSSLTITNWKEEYDNANPFGFLIKYNPNKLSYKGIFDLNSSILKTYPNMIINNITTNFVPMYDYYQIILFDYDKKNNQQNTDDNNNNWNNNEEKKTFSISEFSIRDNINGDGNVLLPIYINKSHWELTKSLWSYHISFINNCFEPEYNVKMDNIYFFTILKFVNNLKNNNNGNIKITIILFGYLLRTCIQILIDNKFIHSIGNDYKKYLESVLNLDTLDKNCTFSDWVVRIIQLIISNGIDDNQLEIDLNKITSVVFKKYIVSNYKMDFWDKINNPAYSDEQKIMELNGLQNNIIQENICWLYLDYDIKLLNKIIKSIYLINGFNQFIKQIDKTNGCLEDIRVENKSINLETIKDIIDLKCSEQFDIVYYNQFIDLSKYCDFYLVNAKQNK